MRAFWLLNCHAPTSFWMLEQMEVLTKRAYLARFLKRVEVPEEMYADANIVTLTQQYTVPFGLLILKLCLEYSHFNVLSF